ncbi:FAD-dependent oxidoreductase [Clostridium sp. BJN0013]|uniref:FAD-dependent oxidoreductase n=1 Tax=Clostridium sp. BJN0013 TaxID=3236840 RepID=UPI0034C5E748
MKRYELIVIGAGPAGLSAAIEAASNGMDVIVFDENSKPGGQLLKQIHKFFGSKAHKAKERGFKIGEELLKEARELGVEVVLNAVVIGIFQNKEVNVMLDGQIKHIKANNIIIATGASENVVPFPGWTMPGVIGAGAAQTMMNIHGLKPGNKILMVGSGNVGLVVAYQLIQAGCMVKAIIDAAPRIGGYGVHATKVARMGVPFYLSHTIKVAYGSEAVEGATIVQVDRNWKAIEGSEKKLDVDTICIAVGLSPMSQLASMAGCDMENNPQKGGTVPICNQYNETSISGIYAAGDVSAIEEASSAMIEGRISGTAVSYNQKYIGKSEFVNRFKEYSESLSQLRQGMFSHENKGRIDLTKTEEGYDISQNLLQNGYLSEKEVIKYPGVVSEKVRKRGIVPIIECTQNIPCDPCQTACSMGCIKIGNTITNLPVVDENSNCIGCGMCVASCSGQAIFLVDENYAPGFAAISMPYELYPLPQKGDKGVALDRAGKVLGEAQVIEVKTIKAMDGTNVLTIKVPLEWSMKARFFKY